MLGNGCGGKTAVPTVSPANAQPSDEDDLGNSTGGRSISLLDISEVDIYNEEHYQKLCTNEDGEGS